MLDFDPAELRNRLRGLQTSPEYDEPPTPGSETSGSCSPPDKKEWNRCRSVYRFECSDYKRLAGIAGSVYVEEHGNLQNIYNPHIPIPSYWVHRFPDVHLDGEWASVHHALTLRHPPIGEDYGIIHFGGHTQLFAAMPPHKDWYNDNVALAVCKGKPLCVVLNACNTGKLALTIAKTAHKQGQEIVVICWNSNVETAKACEKFTLIFYKGLLTIRARSESRTSTYQQEIREIFQNTLGSFDQEDRNVMGKKNTKGNLLNCLAITGLDTDGSIALFRGYEFEGQDVGTKIRETDIPDCQEGYRAQLPRLRDYDDWVTNYGGIPMYKLIQRNMTRAKRTERINLHLSACETRDTNACRVDQTTRTDILHHVEALATDREARKRIRKERNAKIQAEAAYKETVQSGAASNAIEPEP
eukprot:SAG25_NODE_577_length_6782_cov_26.651504_5_plen_413_part_00